MHKCPCFEKGVPNGEPIVFMSGFPDSELSCWGDLLIDELCREHRCIFLCLPGYSQSSEKNDIIPWGYEQEEVLNAMHNCIQSLALPQKFVLMAHDWGAYYALLYTTRYPNATSKLILCDIGMCSPFTLPLTSLPFILFYQLCFAISFFISQAINYALGEWLFQTIGIQAFFAILSPNRTHTNSAHNGLSVQMCYPYYYLLRRLLTGTMLPQAFPSCPLLFMHGTQKWCVYHDQPFLDRIDATPGCSRFSLPAGHWFMIDQAPATIKLVQDFLKQ